MVVDCANGAAAEIAPEAYRRAGAKVTAVAADPDGHNINAGVGSTPRARRAALARTGATVGLAHDGDADRLLAVDEHGALVDGDVILAIAALDARDGTANGTVVTTVMTNLGFRQAMNLRDPGRADRRRRPLRPGGHAGRRPHPGRR